MNHVQQVRASSTFRWLAVLCLALISISASAQVLHFHADDQVAGAAKHCSICLVLHATPAVAQSVLVNVSFQTTAYLQVWANPAHNSASASFALFSRPPPLV